MIEDDEMFFLELELPVAIPGVTLGGARMATGTIIDSTSMNVQWSLLYIKLFCFPMLVQVSFEQSSYSVSEGSNASIVVILSSASSQRQTVTIVSSDNSARGMYIYTVVVHNYSVMIISLC